MREIPELSHHSVRVGESEVLVLNTGARITPEDQAMLGALYSRSPASVRSHLEKLAKKGSGTFMDEFYVQYGHKSIGDLGDGCVFIENVSMLAAKAFQDFPLYNGQEVSTRYVDFATQRFVDPAGTDASRDILERFRAFYVEGMEALIPHLMERFPFDPSADQNDKRYAKAIRARAFDTMRAFLPAGASTSLVWVGPLRQFADQLPILRNHQLAEVAEIAKAVSDVLRQQYPHSFLDPEKVAADPARAARHAVRDEYHTLCQQLYGYSWRAVPKEVTRTYNGIRPDRLSEYRDALEGRPQGAELPWNIRECGQDEFSFELDFGSFRDLQRHRAVTIPMPLLTMENGFEDWYLDELPEGLRATALELLASQKRRTEDLGLSDAVTQYYLPMGYRVPIELTGDLRALTYLVERRARWDVHPTLSRRAAEIAGILKEEYGPFGLVLHLDSEPGRFDVRRGEHDIVRADEAAPA